ncbi:Gfo/Idh/MocA family protein [Novosphingobium taihuense]|uniref:Putative dehydrogenase n=1 Tax=Novosphingobium taihuense TaxID=260085 RepID=A0A7W7ADL9_9SPHN|nr:Gfo/Idh/MocA family oxidoreductase [Novosphingobium taihuense]MBB4615037.1 putative dehydrogenase [Novosphingobium taihuense]TWH84521.1 putative dehydrogenase [Novosphingobium taihuense]
MPTKVGIIGANWSLKVHGTVWRQMANVEVAAVCTAHQETAEAAAAAFGVPKAYWNVAEMAADPDLDIIDVGSRPAYRPEMVMAALDNGKHVYNALPFAVTLDQAKDQTARAKEKGLIGTVDAQFRWVPAALQMKAMIDEGFLGNILGFNVQLLMPLWERDGDYYPACTFPEGGVSPYLWLADKASGGSAWRNFGMHTTLLLTHLIGPVANLSGLLTTGVKEWNLPDGTVLKPDTADLACATLQMENGAIGNLQTGWCVPDSEVLRVEIWGDRGRLLYTDPTFGDGASARLYAGPARQKEYGELAGSLVDISPEYYAVPGTPWSKENAPPYMVSMSWMFHNMLAAIRGEAQASPSFEEALHAHKVVTALEMSSENGKRITLADL